MIFGTTLQQMLFLFSLIIIGYILVKLRLMPEGTTGALAKLENYLFMPALVFGTFASNFTVNMLSSAGRLFGVSIAIEAAVIALSVLATRLITRDGYTRNIYLYGLCISNFGFMGNAIVSQLFPGYFLDYVIFTLVHWVVIYVWAAPSLLMEDKNRKGLSGRLRNLCNPMFICMVLGIAVGLSGLTLPTFVTSLASSTGACMSPIAMLITGMTIAKIDMKRVLRVGSIYIVTALRLLAYPLLFIAVWRLLDLPLSDSMAVCAVASLAMPLGLNTVVIPSAYGRDTTVGAGMALISHVLAVGTIPLIFWIMTL